MNITINETTIQDQVNESIRDTVKNAIKDYAVQAAFTNALASEITNGAIINAVRDAVNRVETAKLADALAQEIQRATVKAVVTIVQEGMVDVIAKIRGLSPYTEDDKREREMLRHRIFGKED